MDMNSIDVDKEHEHIVVENPAVQSDTGNRHLPSHSQSKRSFTSKQHKIPPINIFGITANQIAMKLSTMKITKFSIKKATKDKMVVHTEQLEDFEIRFVNL